MVQWQIVHGICVLEIAIFLILCIPLPATWRHSIMRAVANQPSDSPLARIFQFMFAFLCFMLADAAMGWYRVAQERVGLHKHFSVDQDNYYYMRVFRAQRNAYLAFFAIFLLFVLWRFYNMIKELVNAETMKKQVLGASKQMGELMDQAREGDEAVKKLKDAEKEVERLKRDLDTLKKQGDRNNAEYDRLADEAAKLQNKADKVSSDKKSD